MCNSPVTDSERAPFVENLNVSPESEFAEVEVQVLEEALSGKALSVHDWIEALKQDRGFKYILDKFIDGRRPTAQKTENLGIDTRYLLPWDNYLIEDGILCRTANISGESFKQIVLPHALPDIVFKAYHDDLGHQGRDKRQL